MNTFQKVVKYIALALALSIIVFIITLAFNIINEVFLSIHEESTQKVEYKFQNEVINRMDIDIKGADVSIIYGSEFKIETNIKDVSRSVKSGVLKVKDNSRGYNKDKKMVITIPESNVFENVKISLGRGVSTIESINAKEVDFEIGAGKVVLNNLNITNKAEFECGAGKLEINNSRINNLKLDMGAGEVSVSGVLTGISEFDAGVGKLSIDLLDSIDNYSFTIDKGIGSIKLNNEDVGSDVTIGNGVNTIDIDGGIGEIIVTTK